MSVFLNINCIHNNDGAWCNNKKVKRSLFGIGARCCSEYSPYPKDCPYKEEYPLPKTVPSGQSGETKNN